MLILRRQIFRQIVRNDRRVRVSGGDLCEAEAPTEAAAETILPYFKGVECNMTVRVSSGDLCEAEAPTEAAAEKRVSGGDLCEAEAPTETAAETKDASKMSAQFVERDLFSGSLRSH